MALHRTKVLLAIIALVIGATSVGFGAIATFTNMLPKYASNLQDAWWGFVSGGLLFYGGILLLNSKTSSIYCFIGSTIFYFLGVIVPMESIYGQHGFTYIKHAFYYSLSERILFTIAVAFVLFKQQTVNKALKGKPSAAGTPQNGAP